MSYIIGIRNNASSAQRLSKIALEGMFEEQLLRKYLKISSICFKYQGYHIISTPNYLGKTGLFSQLYKIADLGVTSFVKPHSLGFLPVNSDESFPCIKENIL